MSKIYKIIILLILILFPFSANSHVEHYKNIKRIEFDIYRNKTHAGSHVLSFKRSEKNLSVESKVEFKIEELGITFYEYKSESIELYEDNKLIKFNSKTNQNGKSKYVNIEFRNNKYHIDGSSYKAAVPTDHFIGTWWNHSIVGAKAQISVTSGRIIKQKVKFLGEEIIELDGKNINTLRYKFFSSDKKLSKDKKLDIDIWYDEKTFNWVKASFQKTGRWEYRLRLID